MGDSQALGHRQQLKFAISGLSMPDLAQTSIAAARAVLREVKQNRAQLRAALQDILVGVDAAPKHAARSRLQLAEYAVLECVNHQQLVQLLPSISQQAPSILGAHRKDAACINSLAALLSSCFAKLLHQLQGGHAARHGGANVPAMQELITAEYLCECVLFPAIKSTYRDPEQARVSAGSVVLLGLFEVLKAHTDQLQVVEAVRRCLALMLQLMAQGSVGQRAPGVFLPVCSCVEVVGLNMNRDDTRRLLKQALKSAVVPHSWQVRRDACQALAVLAASLQCRAPTAETSAASRELELVLTPAVELLIANKTNVLSVLDDVRYDKIAAVRTAAASAWAEFKSLPDPCIAAAEDATPASNSDTWQGRQASKPAGEFCTQGSSRTAKLGTQGRSPAAKRRHQAAPPRFVRPKQLSGPERDFGILVFAPQRPQPPPAVSPVQEPPEAADTSQAHSADQQPVARLLVFDEATSARASIDAASQTQPEAALPVHQTYTVQSPLSGGSNPFFTANGSMSPGHDLEQNELQHQLQRQHQQESGLPALLAASGFASSPVRIDVSHHVQGRVELGITYSADVSPAASQPAAAGASPVSPMSMAGVTGPSVADVMAAMAAAAASAGSPGVQHATHTVQPMWGQQQDQQQAQAHTQHAEQQGWLAMPADGMAIEPSFGRACAAATTANAAPGVVPAAPPDLGAHSQRATAADGAGGVGAAAVAVLAADPEQAAAQHQGSLVSSQHHAAAATSCADEVLSAVSPTSIGVEPGHRQHQRWHLPPLSCGGDGGDYQGSSDGGTAAETAEALSRQGTPAEPQMSPRSPTSLDVLRSVGQRVQHLLETLSRQTSNSSRQGSRSPVAALQAGGVQGPPTMAGAPPAPRTATSSSSSCRSSSVASTRAASSAAALADLAVFAVGAELTLSKQPQQPDMLQQPPPPGVTAGWPDTWQQQQQEEEEGQSALQQLTPQEHLYMQQHQRPTDVDHYLLKPGTDEGTVPEELALQNGCTASAAFADDAAAAGHLQHLPERACNYPNGVMPAAVELFDTEVSSLLHPELQHSTLRGTWLQQQQQQQQPALQGPQHTVQEQEVQAVKHADVELPEPCAQGGDPAAQQGVQRFPAGVILQAQPLPGSGLVQEPAEPQQLSPEVVAPPVDQPWVTHAPEEWLAAHTRALGTNHLQVAQQQHMDAPVSHGPSAVTDAVLAPECADDAACQLELKLLQELSNVQGRPADELVGGAREGSCSTARPQQPSVGQHQIVAALQVGQDGEGVALQQLTGDWQQQWQQQPVQQPVEPEPTGALDQQQSNHPAIDQQAPVVVTATASTSTGAVCDAVVDASSSASQLPAPAVVPSAGAGEAWQHIPLPNPAAAVGTSSSSLAEQQEELPQHVEDLGSSSSAPGGPAAATQQPVLAEDMHDTPAADAGHQEAGAEDAATHVAAHAEHVAQEEDQQLAMLLAGGLGCSQRPSPAHAEPTQLHDQAALGSDSHGPQRNDGNAALHEAGRSTLGSQQVQGLIAKPMGLVQHDAQQQELACQAPAQLQGIAQQSQTQHQALPLQELGPATAQPEACDAEVGAEVPLPGAAACDSRELEAEGMSLQLLQHHAVPDEQLVLHQQQHEVQPVGPTDSDARACQGEHQQGALDDLQQSAGVSAAAAVYAAPLHFSVQAATASSSAANVPVTMQYNDLFQAATDSQHGCAPQHPGTTCTADWAPLLAPVSTTFDGVATEEAAAPASGAVVQAQCTGLARVDKALEKLQSLRSTLRHIGSSGAGVASVPLSARASLCSSRTASIQLHSAEASTGALHSHSPAAGQEGTKAQVPALEAYIVEASARSAQQPSGSALASAKDWIREISERLQQVAAPQEQATAGQQLEAQDDLLLLAACGGSAADSLTARAGSCDRGPRHAEVVALAHSPTPPADGAADHAASIGPGGCCSIALDHVATLMSKDVPEMPPVACSQPEAAPELSCATVVDEQMQADEEGVMRLSAAASPGVQLQQAASVTSASWSALTAGSNRSVGGSVELGEDQLQGCIKRTEVTSSNPASAELASTQADEEPVLMSLQAVGTGHSFDRPKQPGISAGVVAPVAVEARAQPHLLQPHQQQQVPSQPLGVADGPLIDADQAAAQMAESQQRLQHMLSQSDDTLLLMSFALKLDRLGRRFRPHGQGLLAEEAGSAAGSITSPVPLPPALWASPARDSPVSPSCAGSPPGPWTSITHNSLYNASPASTPQKMPACVASPVGTVGALPSSLIEAGVDADTAAAGKGPAATSATSPRVAGVTHISSQSVHVGELTDRQQQPEGGAGTWLDPCSELHDATLHKVFGIGMQQLQTGGVEAIAAVMAVMSQLSHQLRQAAPGQLQEQDAHTAMPSRQQCAGAALGLQPELVLLMQDLREELRQQCAAYFINLPQAGNSFVEFEWFAERAEQWFMHNCWPALLQLIH